MFGGNSWQRDLLKSIQNYVKTVNRIIGEVIDEMNLQERTIGVPPAGCAVLAYNYFDIDMGEASHGRAAAVATGIKRALPDRVVFTYQGDGDIAAIGTRVKTHSWGSNDFRNSSQ